MPTFFSGHQLSLSVGSPWCARLWCKSQVHFLPSTTLTRFSSCFNRGCFSCRKKTTKIWRFRAKQGKNPQHFLPAAPSPVPVLPRSCRVRLRSPSSQAGPKRSLEESVISSFSRTVPQTYRKGWDVSSYLTVLGESEVQVECQVYLLTTVIFQSAGVAGARVI